MESVQILNRLLEQDITFWTSIAPSLSDNWWEELISYPLKPTAQHYERTAFVIRGLEQVHYDGSLATAQNLRDLWRSRPPLNSGTRFNHIADQCDELISQLKKAPEEVIHKRPNLLRPLQLGISLIRPDEDPSAGSRRRRRRSSGR